MGLKSALRKNMSKFDEIMAKNIYDGKVSGKRDRGRPRLTFENTVSKILEEGHVKSMRTPRRACMKRLMTVDETGERGM